MTDSSRHPPCEVSLGFPHLRDMYISSLQGSHWTRTKPCICLLHRTRNSLRAGLGLTHLVLTTQQAQRMLSRETYSEPLPLSYLHSLYVGVCLTPEGPRHHGWGTLSICPPMPSPYISLPGLSQQRTIAWVA